MCLLIHQPRGTTFSRAEISDFVDNNPDGFGFMFAHDGKLYTHKMLDDGREVYDAYTKWVAGREAVLHFRMATHGTRKLDNAHPFEIVPGISLAHNGILSIGNPYDSDKTDSEHFVEYFLRPIAEQNPDRLFEPEFARMVGALIGPSNKFVIADWSGRVAIINEESGVRHKRAWMSNTYAWTNPYASTNAGKVWSGYTGVYGTSGYGTSPKDRYAVGGTAPGKAGDGADDDELESWMSSALRDYNLAGGGKGNGLIGLLSWVKRFPTRATEIILSYFNYTAEEAHELVAEYPEQAAEWVLDAVLECAVDEDEADVVDWDDEARDENGTLAERV